MQAVSGSDRVTTEDQDKGKDQDSDQTASAGGSTTRRPTTRRRATSSAADAGAGESKPKQNRKRASRATAEEDTQAAAAAKPSRGRKSASRATAEQDTQAAAAAKPSRGRKSASRATAEQDTQEAEAALQPRPLPRLLERLRTEVGPAMVREFGYTSPMQVPRLSKIVLNIGLGEALQNPRAAENASRDLGLISGQRPVTTRAKKSIAGFKVREGMAIGLAVTLRGRRMYEFLERLINSALPRIRDFQGVSREAFDGRGNYSLGIREQVIFPEIDYNSIDRIRGFQVVVCTTAPTDSEGLRMLELLGMPFVRSRDVARVA